VKLQKDLREFIELLNSLKVDYVVVGGHAVAFHGHPRFTGDIDFLVRPTRENAERLLRALRAFGFSAWHCRQAISRDPMPSCSSASLQTGLTC